VEKHVREGYFEEMQ
jgi:hypothetical protein